MAAFRASLIFGCHAKLSRGSYSCARCQVFLQAEPAKYSGLPDLTLKRSLDVTRTLQKTTSSAKLLQPLLCVHSLLYFSYKVDRRQAHLGPESPRH